MVEIEKDERERWRKMKEKLRMVEIEKDERERWRKMREKVKE